jgi:hypothetical protein
MLESINNAVKRYHQMGVLIRDVKIVKRIEIVTYRLSDVYQDETKIRELYEAVIFYLPYSPNLKFSKMQTEIKRLLLSDIQLIAKL